MTFVLDASVTMTWLLGDATPSDRAYAAAVLAASLDPMLADLQARAVRAPDFGDRS